MVPFILAVISAMLINNVTLSRFYGICPFLGVSKKTDSALGMGLAVFFVTMIAAAVTWPIYTYVLVPANIGFMDTIVYILVIASLVQLVEMFIKKFSPALYKSLGVYLPLITTNCAVLGVTINNINDGYTFVESMVSSLGCGLGFLLAMVLFAGIRSKIEESEIPQCFKGLPVTLIAASFYSFAVLLTAFLFVVE